MTSMDRPSRPYMTQQLDLIDIFKILHPKNPQNRHSFQVHMGHAVGQTTY